MQSDVYMYTLRKPKQNRPIRTVNQTDPPASPGTQLPPLGRVAFEEIGYLAVVGSLRQRARYPLSRHSLAPPRSTFDG
jgi:hypothetical protein